MTKTNNLRDSKALSSATTVTGKYTTEIVTYLNSMQDAASKIVSSSTYATIGTTVGARGGRYLSTSSSKQESYRTLNSALTGSKLKY